MPAFAWLVTVAIKSMSVAQPESGVHHRPRKNHCAEREQQMRSEMTTQHGFVNTDQKPYCKQCRTSRHHDKNKNHQPADVLLFGPRTQFVDGRCQNGQPTRGKERKRRRRPKTRSRLWRDAHDRAEKERQRLRLEAR